MTDVAATGPISLPMERLRTLLAASSAWQDWTDTSGEADPAAAAAESVYLVAPPEATPGAGFTAAHLQSLRPFATVDILRDGRAYGAQRLADGSPFGGFQFTDEGSLLLMFEDNVAAELVNDPRNGDVTFMNRVGAVLLDLQNLAGAPLPAPATNGGIGYLRIRRIDLVRLDRSDESASEVDGETPDNRHEAGIVIQWGAF